MDPKNAGKAALRTIWEEKNKPTSSRIPNHELKYAHNEDPPDPFSASVAEQIANRDMSDSPPEA